MDSPRSEPALDNGQNLRLMIAGMRDHALFMLDPRGQVASWDAGAEALMGYSAAEILGHPLSQFYTPEDAALGKPDRDLQAALTQGQHDVVEQRRRKDGSRFWADVTLTAIRDATGTLVGFGALTRDVSQRIDAERKLRASEERLKALVETVLARLADGIVILSDSGAIGFVNAPFAQVFGQQAEALRGRNIKSLIAPGSHAVLDKFLSDVHRRGASDPDLDPRELQGLRNDGATFPLVMSLGEVVIAGESLFAGVVRDLADRRRSDSQLVQSLKADVLAPLSASIANEFSNLLTVIVGSTEALNAVVETRPELKRHVDMIRTASERGAELSQRLSALSRPQELLPATVDLNQLVRGLRQLLRRTLREEIDLKFDLAEVVAPIKVDPAALEAAIFSLALKAEKAAATGRITILSRETKGEGSAAGSSASIGIVAEPHAGAMQPEASGPIDIAAIRDFVERSGGTLHHELRAGAFNTCLVFPLAPPAVKDAGTPAEAKAAQAGFVLVAEDDPFVRSYAVTCLESLGYKVVAAVDGRDALAHLAQGINPDVLFTDIVMPGGLNGWQLAEQALAQRPTLKVLYTSGYALETLSENGHLAPNVRVLNKPYRRAELGRHMRELMDEIRNEIRAASG